MQFKTTLEYFNIRYQQQNYFTRKSIKSLRLSIGQSNFKTTAFINFTGYRNIAAMPLYQLLT